MAPRSSWKGFIKLSLVSVPVKAYTATASGAEISLNQLHTECNSRISYKKVCPLHGEVSNADITKGYEYAKGQYVVIEDDELEKLRTSSDRSINIDGFVAPESLDPVFHAGRTYYLVPDGAVGQKPYSLLLRCMLENNVHAMAQVVISQREQLVMLRPVDGVLAMTLLNHQMKVKSADSVRDEIAADDATAEELKLTTTLINASTLSDFDFGSYTDRYVEKLTDLIQLKVDGEEVVQVPDAEEPKIINLMEALKKSVAEAQSVAEVPVPGAAKKASNGKAGKKQAPSAKSKSTAATTTATNSRKRKAG
jgi:DNA end-binding protein Ku